MTRELRPRNPDDFAVQIADQIESFLVARHARSRKGERARTRPCPSCSWRSPSCCWPAAAWARTRTSCRTSATSRTPGPEPDVDELRERLALLLDPIDVYSEVFDPYEPRKAPVAAPGSPTTWPTSSPTCATAWPTTGRAGTTRGPVVVAVLLLLQLGLPGLGHPARPPERGRPRPPRRRRRSDLVLGRRGRGGRRTLIRLALRCGMSSRSGPCQPVGGLTSMAVG